MFVHRLLLISWSISELITKCTLQRLRGIILTSCWRCRLSRSGCLLLLLHLFCDQQEDEWLDSFVDYLLLLRIWMGDNYNCSQSESPFIISQYAPIRTIVLVPRSVQSMTTDQWKTKPSEEPNPHCWFKSWFRWRLRLRGFTQCVWPGSASQPHPIGQSREHPWKVYN